MKLITNNLHITESKYNDKHLLQYNANKLKNENENKNDIHTKRPAQALSFGGSITNTLGSGFVKNKTMNKLTAFVKDNEAAYKAVNSLIIAGMLKPFFVLRTKGAEEKDKQIIATKNFLQAFIGSFLGFTIEGKVIKKATDTFKNNLSMVKFDPELNNFVALKENDSSVLDIARDALKKENDGIVKRFSRAINARSEGKGFFEAFKKQKNYTPDEKEVAKKAGSLIENLKNRHLRVINNNPQYIKELLKDKEDVLKNKSLYDAFDSVWKNSAGTFTAISKAIISSALLPGVMAFIFAKRNLEKQREEAEKSGALLNNNSLFNNEKQKFIGMLDKQNTKKTDDNIAFSGQLTTKLTDNMALGLEKIAMSKPGEAFVKGMNKLPGALNKPSARMADLESFGLTAYWLANTTLSKKIEPSQKLGLNVHTALVTGVSSVCAFLIDTLLDPLVNSATNSYKKELEGLAQTLKENNIASNAKDVENAIGNECKKLFKSKKIIDGLSSVDLKDTKALGKVIDELSVDYKKGLGKLKSLTVFTLVVRFLVPVLMVKPSNKLKQKIVERKKQKEEMKAKKEEK